MYQSEWGASQAVLRGKFLAFNDCTEKRRKVLNQYIKFYLKKLEKEAQIK